MNYQAKKIRLLCGEDIVRAWSNYMISHIEEVVLSLRRERVRHEIWFLGRDTSLFLIGVMDAEDATTAALVAEKSELSVDKIHKEFKSHWDRSSIEPLSIDRFQAPRFDGYELLFEARG